MSNEKAFAVLNAIDGLTSKHEAEASYRYRSIEGDRDHRPRLAMDQATAECFFAALELTAQLHPPEPTITALAMARGDTGMIYRGCRVFVVEWLTGVGLFPAEFSRENDLDRLLSLGRV